MTRSEERKLWFALLKEWLEDLKCKSDTLGTHDLLRFGYMGLDFKIWVRDGRLNIKLLVDRIMPIYLKTMIYEHKRFKFSEFDIQNPNTTPRERFKILEGWMDEVIKIYKKCRKEMHGE